MNQSCDPAFVQLITRHQRQLHAYISTLVPSASEADDILQESNLTLLRKADDFTQGTSFMAWACRIAYFEVLGHYRKRRRERQVAILDDDVAEVIAGESAAYAEQTDDRMLALRQCLPLLSERSRRLLQRFYSDEQPLKTIAQEFGQSDVAVRVSLHRVRVRLMECIQRRLTGATS